MTLEQIQTPDEDLNLEWAADYIDTDAIDNLLTDPPNKTKEGDPKKKKKVEENKTGGKENIKTTGERAGTSEYTGSSNLLHEKLDEMIGKDIFDGNWKITEIWKDKLVNEFNVPREDADNAIMEDIHKGTVGKAFGKMLQEAYGVNGLGVDMSSRGVDVNVSGQLNNPKINNQFHWVSWIIDDVKDNDNMLPSKYTHLPEDLKNEITRIARNDIPLTEGKFSQTLNNAYRKANESVTTEIDRQASYTFSDADITARREAIKEVEGPVDLGDLEFWDAFKVANGEDFMWRGELKSWKTRWETSQEDLNRMNSNSWTTLTKEEYTATKQAVENTMERVQSVNNPERKLKKIGE